MTRTSEELEFLKEGEIVWKQGCGPRVFPSPVGM